MDRKRIEIPAGTEITQACRMASSWAKTERCDVTFEFNGTLVTVSPGDSDDRAIMRWCDARRSRENEEQADLAALRARCEAADKRADVWERSAKEFADDTRRAEEERDALKAAAKCSEPHCDRLIVDRDEWQARAERAERKLARVREWCDSTEQECLDTEGAECSVEGRCGIANQCVVPEIRAILDEGDPQ